MTNEFESIVEAHYAGLYRFGLSLAKDEATACDLTQQTFLKWARYGHQLRDRSKVKTWLFTTLHREFLALRRKTRELADEEELENLPAEPARGTMPSIDAQAAVEALQQLDEVFRAPVAMFYLEEMSYAEIAECLEVPVGTIMSRLSRGRDRLRRILLSEPRRR
ncbi:MAG: RNA polymerase sigma factor [Verrucomicrobia bacterium]|nr:RNA polymerase sigma factor [Verrucomicrobiota bacterium]